ncbi:MAG: small subunit ribosomal protein S4 [Microgenomates group bacterium LiPW_31]|nr:MAG: small subunit ribosomal protein S4 [Microgenomates group bacterium LiPW_31]
MARYLDSKCRLCRREGTKLFLKGERCFSPKCPLEKRGAVSPGQHGLKRSRRLSEYGIQLREKQKAKRTYGVLERQFRRYFKKAFKKRGVTGEALLQLLELRLDNVVYRLGFVPSRSVARQIVHHGHILVDGKKVDIPSYQVKPGQVINLNPKAMKMEVVKKSLAEKKKEIPSWLQKKAAVGKIIRLPTREEIGADIAEQLIVEYYSR